ncbi:hypothetical protein [Halalkalibacter urbisdiaboli]|uniref:hypothetical protein n=1 Tax=Halalkalibacter urbisdiaboli TaxID=1960589 RepID=UPI000B446680|nr:hypothetical protein [Halalkalibacter urbisdiaboli]
MKINIQSLVFIVTPILVVTLLFLWLTGFIGLWTGGIAEKANNTKDFTTTKSHFIAGDYSISIDLSNLESNIGKELYNDGKHTIYVSSVNNTGSENTGGYSISFRSSGRISLNAASLVSGVQHARINEHSFTNIMTAKMTAEYNGKIYESPISGVSGLNYKDGDEFGFYIFPHESYQEIRLNEQGVVGLTVSNLYKNIWSKN